MVCRKTGRAESNYVWTAYMKITATQIGSVLKVFDFSLMLIVFIKIHEVLSLPATEWRCNDGIYNTASNSKGVDVSRLTAGWPTHRADGLYVRHDNVNMKLSWES